MADTTNGPKSENSCLLLNSRYVLMFGGCYPEQNPYWPCLSYSFDPLLYDVTRPGWSDYTYHTNGYFVPQTVSGIIGGEYSTQSRLHFSKSVTDLISSTVGGALQSRPMFVDFADPSLQGLFDPPYHRRQQGGFYYDALVVRVLPVLLCVPFLFTFCYVGVKFCLNAKTQKQKDSNWKPWALQYPYLLFVTLMTVGPIAAVVFLYKSCEIPDPDPERKYDRAFSQLTSNTRGSLTL